jgi:hypothetical protein
MLRAIPITVGIFKWIKKHEMQYPHIQKWWIDIMIFSVSIELFPAKARYALPCVVTKYYTLVSLQTTMKNYSDVKLPCR